MDSLRKPNTKENTLEKSRLTNISETANFDFENLIDKKSENTTNQLEKSLTENQPGISLDEQGVGVPGINTNQSPLHQAVEAILEEDLEDLYFSLDPQTQVRFKKQGEITANKIIELISSTKATFQKVFKLIMQWLRVIPRVNKYFLEQEAKIKADRILAIEK